MWVGRIVILLSCCGGSSLRFPRLNERSGYGDLGPFPLSHQVVVRVGIFLALLLALCPVSISQNQRLSSLIREGRTALDAGDFPSAARNFEQARQLAPDDLEANRGLLLSYLQEGRLEQAEEIGKIAVERWPREADLQHWLGLVYFKKSQNSAALAALQRAESLDPSRSDAHFDIALVFLSDSNDTEAALELEKAIKLDPKAALAHVL